MPSEVSDGIFTYNCHQRCVCWPHIHSIKGIIVKKWLCFLALALIGANTLAADKLIIAHRGASGYLPEHTLESKALAFGQGADYLEQDLVMTKDNHLVVIHDHFLDGLTDVAQKFPGRARADGKYYVPDFTLAEIRSLQMTENFKTENGKQVPVYPDRFPLWQGSFKIHTFEEELQFVRGLEKSSGKRIGIYPEIKAPWLHHQEGKDIARATLAMLKKYGYQDENKPWKYKPLTNKGIYLIYTREQNG